MRKKASSAAFISVLLLSLVFGVHFAKAGSKTIIVPDDFSTIGAAIANASQGDTIFAKKGSYYENLTISKSIFLVGEDRDTTIIDGQVNINYDNVTITSFTIQNALGTTDYGIQLFPNVGYCNISGNRIQRNSNGIQLITSSNNNIIGNIVDSNSGVGIMLYGSSPQGSDYNNIQGNEIFSNGGEGIVLRLNCSNNNITGNYISRSSREGILFSWAGNNVIGGNNITECGSGIGDAGDGNTFFHNNFIDNTQQVYTNWLNEATGQMVISVGSWNENYWSDYNGTDDNYDGIGDTPYVIDEKNEDNRPLMAPFGSSTGLPSPSPSPTPTQPTTPFPTTLIAIAITMIVAVVSFGLVAYSLRRKGKRSEA